MYSAGAQVGVAAGAAGGLFGTKIVLNEFVAFIDLGALQPGALSERSRAIVTFALCGFANFSSIAIQIGGIGGLAPERRGDLARFGLRAPWPADLLGRAMFRTAAARALFSMRTRPDAIFCGNDVVAIGVPAA